MHRSTVRLALAALLGVACVAGVGCGSTGSTPAPRPEAVLDAKGEPVGLEHHHRWSDRIGQGAQPEGDVAFRNLAALGYKTVVSVDGAKPDVETAAKHGLRYVHVPIEYSGITRDQALRIIQAVKTSDGPVYVHCHHGLHRGPVGAMVARISLDGISNEEALKELKDSNCSPKYTGLYRDIGAFVAPTAEEMASVPTDLPSYVSPGDVPAHMAITGRIFERLVACDKAGWKAPANSPDVNPPHEATILRESFREMLRLEEVKTHEDRFVKWMNQSEADSASLEAAIVGGKNADATAALARIKKSCDSCHAQYRDK
ncbi:MAG: cytochrome c [Planctomycetes bacterium]|nr:cytochrome c [Planctomycetota bacterium]